MKEDIVKEFEELEKMVQKTTNEEDLEPFDKKIKGIYRLLENYIEEDREEVLKWMIEKNHKIETMLKEKMNVIKNKLIQEDEQNRNRGTYKLYE